MKIYALKPFEADIGCISPANDLSTLTHAADDDGRGTSADVIQSLADDVIVAPGATSGSKDATM